MTTNIYITFAATTASIESRSYHGDTQALTFNVDGTFYIAIFELVMKYNGNYEVIGHAIRNLGIGGDTHNFRQCMKQFCRIATGRHHFHHVGMMDDYDIGKAAMNVAYAVEKYISTKYGKKHVYSYSC